MTLWQAAILGLVEGITEFLPVSSTGHLILAASLMGLDRGPHAKAVEDLDIVVQGGAILAVLVLYHRRVRALLAGLVGRDPAGLRLLGRLLLAFTPAALAGLLLGDLITEHLFSPGPVLGALFVGGVLMIVVDRPLRARPETCALDALSWRGALFVGLVQCLALWPGTSRAMVTLLGGLLVGLAPAAAAELTFLLGVLTLGAASAYKLLDNLRDAARDGTPNLFEALGVGPCVVAVAVATLSAALAVRWLTGFLTRRGLAPFGWYRIALAVMLGGFAYAGVVRF